MAHQATHHSLGVGAARVEQILSRLLPNTREFGQCGFGSSREGLIIGFIKFKGIHSWSLFLEHYLARLVLDGKLVVELWSGLVELFRHRRPRVFLDLVGRPRAFLDLWCGQRAAVQRSSPEEPPTGEGAGEGGNERGARQVPEHAPRCGTISGE